jgi:hypothetical protein
MFENRVLRKILGPKRYEVVGCRKLRNEELHNLCSSPKYNYSFQVEGDEMGRAHVARMG